MLGGMSLDPGGDILGRDQPELDRRTLVVRASFRRLVRIAKILSCRRGPRVEPDLVERQRS